MFTDMRILVTGFNTFGSHQGNPSSAVAAMVDGLALPYGQVVGIVLDTSFETVESEVPKLVEQISPALIIMFGLNANLPSIHLESGAHNWVAAEIPDNRGHMPLVGPIDGESPAWIPSIFNVEEIVGDLNAQGVSCETSNDPGFFVCNFAYFTALQSGLPTLFVHLPQKNTLHPTLLEDARRIVEYCTDTVFSDQGS